MKKGGPKDAKSNNNNINKGGPAPAKQPEQKPETKPKDFSTAILDRKKAPHRLIVEEGAGPSEDASVIQLTQKKKGRIKNI